MGIRESLAATSNRKRQMFLFYFNKLGCVGSALVSVALTLALVAAFRMFAG